MYLKFVHQVVHWLRSTKPVCRSVTGSTFCRPHWLM